MRQRTVASHDRGVMSASLRATERARLAVLALSIIAVTLALAAPAAACSAGPDFDPRAATDLVIAGRVTGIEIAPTANQAGFHRIAVTVAVDAVLRGHAPGSVLTFVDDASVYVDPLQGTIRFAGASGACGVLDEDPTGRYAVIALKRAPDGELLANRLYGAAFGDGPTDPGLRWVLDRHLVSLPNTSTIGSSPVVTTADPHLSSVQGPRMKASDGLVTAFALAAVIVVAARLMFQRLRRSRSRPMTR